MNRIKKLIKKLNNRGSSVVMVIVSVAFVAIIVGALLTAASYAYRLKIVNKNAKNNFYIAEQAMHEIYAGVGSKTVDQMYDAYTTTIENMVVYDLGTSSYVTISNEEANKMFKKQFMLNIQNEEYFKQSDEDLAKSLANFITNDTVKIDTKALHKEVVIDKTGNIEKIVLKNVTLTRTSDYKNNSGEGSYTQTISADIEICQPDFSVNFDNTHADYSKIFDYCLVGDMGVQIEQPNQATTLKITGNIYASSDYYNKNYNSPKDDNVTFKNEAGKETKTTNRNFKYSYNVNIAEGKTENRVIEYIHGPVYSKKYNNRVKGTSKDCDLYNKYATDEKKSPLYFDGQNQYSMNSGLFISGTDVSIMAENIIVPGTIAVMNDADLSVYNKESGTITTANVWTDNVVLGGYGERYFGDKKIATPKGSSWLAPSAYFYANMYVRDDTELNAERSSFKLKGNYYGYGNSTTKDTRVFVPTVDEINFKIPVERRDEKGNLVIEDGKIVYDHVNRDHYNSSSIVINGQNTVLDLSSTGALYLAGRAYIELSKDVTYAGDDGSVYVDSASGQLVDKKGDNTTNAITETYSYHPVDVDDKGNKIKNSDGTYTYIKDYKTGESLSMKSSQVAYIPIILNGLPGSYEYLGLKYETVELHPSVVGISFFDDFFPKDLFGSKVPVTSQTISGKQYYYYDLDTAYEIIERYKDKGSASEKVKAKTVTDKYKTVDEYTAAFVVAYTNEVNKPTDPDNPLPLNDILANDDFSMGNIIVANSDKFTEDGTNNLNGVIYSSGAITTRNDTVFSMVLKNKNEDLNALLTYTGYKVDGTGSISSLDLSNKMEKDYLYIKWNLGEFGEGEEYEKQYIDQMLSNGWTEDMITPINRYLVMSKIDGSKKVTPSGYTLASDYKLWITDEDVVVGENAKDFTDEKTGTIKGIIITKADVTFNEKVKRFEGLIVSGGKIYICGSLESITASPEICRSILKECMLNDDETSKYIRNVFSQYKESEDGKCPVCKETLVDKKCPKKDCAYNNTLSKNEMLVEVNSVDYTSVCVVNNWNKSVE